MEDFSPSRGWAAEDLVRMYDLMTNGGAGAGDYASSAGAWGARPEQIQQMAMAAEENNRKREADALAYRAAITKAMLEAQSARATSRAGERLAAAKTRAEADKETAMYRWLASKQGGGQAGPSALTDDMKMLLKARGVNPQDIPGIEADLREGRGINPNIMQQYIQAREDLGKLAAKSADEKQGPKLKLTDTMKQQLMASKLPELSKAALWKAMETGDMAMVEKIPGGLEWYQSQMQPPGQKATKQAPAAPAAAAATPTNAVPPDASQDKYRQNMKAIGMGGGLASMFGDSLSDAYGGGEPGLVAAVNATMDPWGGDEPGFQQALADTPGRGWRPPTGLSATARQRGPDLSRANPFQGEPLPHPGAAEPPPLRGNYIIGPDGQLRPENRADVEAEGNQWKGYQGYEGRIAGYSEPTPRNPALTSLIEVYKEKQADYDRLKGEYEKTPENGLASKTKAVAGQELEGARQARIAAYLAALRQQNRPDTTDEWGRPLNAQGKPTANWRGEAYPTQAPAGTPGYAEKLQAAMQQAAAQEEGNWYEGQYVGKGAPDYAPQETFTSLDQLIPNLFAPAKGAAIGAMALGTGLGIGSRMMADRAAKKAVSGYWKGLTPQSERLLPAAEGSFGQEIKHTRLLPPGKVLANDTATIYPKATINPRYRMPMSESPESMFRLRLPYGGQDSVMQPGRRIMQPPIPQGLLEMLGERLY